MEVEKENKLVSTELLECRRVKTKYHTTMFRMNEQANCQSETEPIPIIKLGELPAEILTYFFTFLSPSMVIRMATTCKWFKQLIYETNSLWKELFMHYW